MDIGSFNEILNNVIPAIERKDSQLRAAIPPEERLALTLRYLATGDESWGTPPVYVRCLGCYDVTYVCFKNMIRVRVSTGLQMARFRLLDGVGRILGHTLIHCMVRHTVINCTASR